MAENGNGFHQILVPTREQANMFIRLFWESITQGTLEDLEADASIGPAANAGHGPDVFWGVPRFNPGFRVYSYLGGPVAAIFGTVAQLKQIFQTQAAGLTLNQLFSNVEAEQHPFHEDHLIIYMDSELTFAPPGAGHQNEAYLRFEVLSRVLNERELHFSLVQIDILWL
eukprot:scpid83325/ scgid13652/ 